MLGTIINASAIVLGGILGLAWKKNLSAPSQMFFKAALGAFTVFYGLRLTVISFSFPFLSLLKQLLIVILALALGKMTGRLLHLQKGSNRIGQFARDRMMRARPDNPNRFSDGFSVCAALFCVAPLGILGAITDGLSGYFYPLVIKAVMDALAVMSFVAMFGWGVLLSAVPVLVFQGTISLLCTRFAAPFLDAHHLLDSANATAGLVIFCVALLIFEIRKIEVTDYLPSLFFAPLLTYFLG